MPVSYGHPSLLVPPSMPALPWEALQVCAAGLSTGECVDCNLADDASCRNRLTADHVPRPGTRCWVLCPSEVSSPAVCNPGVFNCVPASRLATRQDRERARVQSRVYFRSSLTTSVVPPRLYFSGRVHHVFPGGQMPKGPSLEMARPRAPIPCRTMACAAG